MMSCEEMPLLNCAKAAQCGCVHLGKKLGLTFYLNLKVFNLWVGSCTKLHWAAVRGNICSGAENFPWSHPGSWCSFVQHSNLSHPESPLGEVPQEAKGRFDFQYIVVTNRIVLAATVYCSTKHWTKEFCIFECFPMQVSGNNLNYFFCKLNVSLQVSKPLVSFTVHFLTWQLVWNLLCGTASTWTLSLMIGSPSARLCKKTR